MKLLEEADAIGWLEERRVIAPDLDRPVIPWLVRTAPDELRAHSSAKSTSGPQFGSLMMALLTCGWNVGADANVITSSGRMIAQLSHGLRDLLCGTRHRDARAPEGNARKWA